MAGCSKRCLVPCACGSALVCNACVPCETLAVWAACCLLQAAARAAMTRTPSTRAGARARRGIESERAAVGCTRAGARARHVSCAGGVRPQSLVGVMLWMVGYWWWLVRGDQPSARGAGQARDRADNPPHRRSKKSKGEAADDGGASNWVVDVLVNGEPGWNGTSPGVGTGGRPRLRVAPSSLKGGAAHVVTFPLSQVGRGGCGCDCGVRGGGGRLCVVVGGGCGCAWWWGATAAVRGGGAAHGGGAQGALARPSFYF